MSNRRIDELRQRVADIGKRQVEYHRFFPRFADRVAQALGEYLGDPTAVALTVNEGPFDFDNEYRHAGVGFERGFYRIPIMVRLDNLEDDGAFLLRLRLFCERRDGRVFIAIDDEDAQEVDGDGPLSDVCDQIFASLLKRLSEGSVIDSHASDHKRIEGFIRSPKQ